MKRTEVTTRMEIFDHSVDAWLYFTDFPSDRPLDLIARDLEDTRKEYPECQFRLVEVKTERTETILDY